MIAIDMTGGATTQAGGTGTPAPLDPLAPLIQRIVHGEQAALDSLHRACASRVLSIALRFLQRRELAEEAVSDCFWQIWREAARYDAARGPAIAWILSIARSRAIDALRKNRVRSRNEMSSDDEEDRPLAYEVRLVCTAAETARRQATVLCLVNGLARMPAQLMWMAYYQGLSHQEICDHTGLPLGTVKSHLKRSLASLHERCLANGDSLDSML